MVPVAGAPFIEWVLRYFEREGVRRFVVALGHLGEVAEAYLLERDGSAGAIRCTHERELLGTGGAAVLAATAAGDADIVLVTNADSVVLAPLEGLWPLLARPEVDAVVVGVEVDDTARFGSLVVSGAGRLEGFREKVPGRGLINAGLYAFKRRTLERFPTTRPLSLEREVFPALLAAGADIRVLGVKAPFLDMGTPESLAQAEGFVRRNWAAAGTEAAR